MAPSRSSRLARRTCEAVVTASRTAIVTARHAVLRRPAFEACLFRLPESATTAPLRRPHPLGNRSTSCRGNCQGVGRHSCCSRSCSYAAAARAPSTKTPSPGKTIDYKGAKPLELEDGEKRAPKTSSPIPAAIASTGSASSCPKAVAASCMLKVKWRPPRPGLGPGVQRLRRLLSSAVAEAAPAPGDGKRSKSVRCERPPPAPTTYRSMHPSGAMRRATPSWLASKSERRLRRSNPPTLRPPSPTRQRCRRCQRPKPPKSLQRSLRRWPPPSHLPPPPRSPLPNLRPWWFPR